MNKSLLFIAVLAILSSREAGLSPKIAGGSGGTTHHQSCCRQDSHAIGDLVTLTLTAKSPGIAMVKKPGICSSFLKDFELRNAKKPLVQEKEGERTTGI